METRRYWAGHMMWIGVAMIVAVAAWLATISVNWPMPITKKVIKQTVTVYPEGIVKISEEMSMRRQIFRYRVKGSDALQVRSIRLIPAPIYGEYGGIGILLEISDAGQTRLYGIAPAHVGWDRYEIYADGRVPVAVYDGLWERIEQRKVEVPAEGTQ